MITDYSAAKFWLELFQFAGIIAVGVWTYLRTKDKDNDSAIAGLAERLAAFVTATNQRFADGERRMDAFHAELRHMPTKEQLAEVAGQVSAQRAMLDGLEDLVKRIEHQTNLIHDHLLNR